MQGDCLERMAEIPDASVDLIAADLPYGSTQAKWDSIIPIGALWAEYRRVLTPSGAVVLTADLRFAVQLIAGNRDWFRYDLVWHKSMPVGFLDAKRRPLRSHELILVFAPRPATMTYNPQMTAGKPYRKAGTPNDTVLYAGRLGYRQFTENRGTRHPASVIPIPNRSIAAKLHPTQKPVALMDWIVRTYTDPGDTVLDNTMGSGTTGVAAIQNGRKFIGIERDPAYFEIASKRIAAVEPTLFAEAI